MNLTHNLEQFTNELTDIFNRLVLLKHDYPTLFKEVLPDGEELRLEDALTALQNAVGEAEKVLINAGTNLEVD